MFPPFLKIAVLPWPYFIVLDGTKENNVTITGGILYKIVEILSQYYNFKYELLIPKDGQFGVPDKDGKFSGIIGMVNRSEADIGLGPLVINEARHNAVDFIVYNTDALTFVTNIPKQLKNTFFYLDPFDYTFWIIISVILLILSLFYNHLQNNQSYIGTFMTMFGYFIKQTSKIKPINTQQDILFAFWNIFTCIINLCYSALLFSFMVAPLYEKGVQNVKELAEAMSKGTHKCYSYSGTADFEFLMNSDDVSLQYISQQIIKNNWLFSSHSEFPRNVEEIIGTNVAITVDKSVIQMERDSDIQKKLLVFEENVVTSQCGMVVRKDFCCTHKLARSISRIINAGIYQKAFNQEVHRLKILKYKSYMPDYVDKTITIHHVSGVFILLVGGYLVSSVVLVCEILVNVYRKRKISPRY